MALSATHNRAGHGAHPEKGDMRNGLVCAVAIVIALLTGSSSYAQEPSADSLAGRLSAVETAVQNLKKFKVSGYVQARYEYHDDAISNPALGTASTDSRNMGKLLNRFYIRRGRLKVTFQANKNASGVVYFDGSASGVSLKEAFVALTEPRSEVRFTLGQFNWPFGYEVSFSSSKREFPERARWSRTLFPGERDRGVKVERAFKIEDRYDLNLTAGVFNGNGIEDRVFGATDPNKSKDFIARAACDFGALDVGVSGYWGEQFNPSDSAVPVQTPSSTDKIRYGADAQFAFDVPRLGGGALKAEFVVGQEPKNQSKAFLSSDTTRDVTGLDVVLAQNLHPNLQFISRIDYYDPDRDIKSDEFVAYGLGLVYFWDNHSKVKLVYEIPKSGKNARSGLEPGTTKDLKDNILTMEWVYTF